MGVSPHVLIIVQNLPVPLDRRVWLECNALRDAGYEVSVICPKGPGDPAYQELDGVHLYKYRPAPPTSGVVSYLVEFVYSWLRTAWLTLKVARRRRFHVMQACNPPDTYWALALLWKLRGVKFVFDQHDLNPEVFLSRFGTPTGLAGRIQYAGLRWLERRTYRTARHVISTNESYRAIATGRGRVPHADTTVVRSGPDTTRMRPVDGLPALRNGRRHLLAYLGIMGPQDGVDVVLRAADILVHELGHDVQVALLGFGDSYDDLVALASELKLDDHVTFTGRADLRMIAEYLSSADIGLSPDPRNPLNDVSTMNKTMEYMAFALPVVAFDLTETIVSGGDAAAYVSADEPLDDAVRRFAVAVGELLDDPARRAEMALAGRRRAEQVLDWQPQRRAYVSVFDRLTGRTSALPEPAVPAAGGTDEWGHQLVDVTDDQALRSFAVARAR
jgi:glycosyltransferase involved in cell wall biosynthesis